MTMRHCAVNACMPVVNLDERPMKTNFGMRSDRTSKSSAGKPPVGTTAPVLPKPATPQLSGPAAAPAAPRSNPTQPYQPKPKPPVNLTDETLDAMDDVMPVTMGEINDEIPW